MVVALKAWGGRLNVTTGRARCTDGTSLAFRLAERGEGAPRIVLVHSLAMDHSFWLPVAAQLSGEASVLVYDCRGHGASEKPAGPYTTELFARDLADVMDHVGWGSAVVAGASMGGCVSLAFGAAFPQRAAALGLVDTTAWYGADAPQQWAERATRALTDGLAGLIDFQVSRWFGETFRVRRPEIVEHCVAVFLANTLPAYAETCRMLGAHDVRPALPRLAMPATIVVGEEDYATPVAMAQALHDGIKNSRLVVIEKARHLTPLEVPERVAAELKKLLEGSVRR
jgi:3-oxoadipate enol-lactonase